MADPLEQVLRLVAEGRLTAAEAAPILDALGSAGGGAGGSGSPSGAGDDQPAEARTDGPRGATSIRIEVSDGGRKVVNLRVPISLGRFGLDRIPGLGGGNIDLVRQALAEGRSGTILDIDDDGHGVRIALE
jgi:hypothetical protein